MHILVLPRKTNEFTITQEDVVKEFEVFEVME